MQIVEHEYNMKLALSQAKEALSLGQFPVGCVITCEGKVISSGQRGNSSSSSSINELDHGEMRALRSLLDQKRNDVLSEVTVYSTMEPCLMCFSTLLVNGVRRFVYGYEDVMGGGTNLPLHMLSPLYRDLEISVTGNILREESLVLFKRFFSEPGNLYLKDSLLARYTLDQ